MLGSQTPNKVNWTHVEDLRDPDKVLLPGCDLALIVLDEDESGDCTPFPQLCDPPSDLGQGPMIVTSVSG